MGAKLESDGSKMGVAVLSQSCVAVVRSLAGCSYNSMLWLACNEVTR
jgi:hypothetical protein